jgi:hypothetical protein
MGFLMILSSHSHYLRRSSFDRTWSTNDDQVLAVAHREDGRSVLDLIVNQGTRPPFDPLRVIP